MTAKRPHLSAPPSPMSPGDSDDWPGPTRQDLLRLAKWISLVELVAFGVLAWKGNWMQMGLPLLAVFNMWFVIWVTRRYREPERIEVYFETCEACRKTCLDSEVFSDDEGAVFCPECWNDPALWEDEVHHDED